MRTPKLARQASLSLRPVSEFSSIVNRDRLQVLIQTSPQESTKFVSQVVVRSDGHLGVLGKLCDLLVRCELMLTHFSRLVQRQV